MVTAVQFSASTQHHLGRGAPPERLPERAQCGSDRKLRMTRMAAPGGCGQIRAPLTATVKNTSVGAAEADLGCRLHPSTTVASILPVWSSPGRVGEGRSVDVCCGLVGLAGRLGTRTGGAQGADRTGVRQGRNTGDRWSFSRRLVVGGRAQNRLASG